MLLTGDIFVLFAHILTTAQRLIKNIRLYIIQETYPSSWRLCYVLQFCAYHEWYYDFQKVFYDFMSYLYVIIFDSHRIQNQNTSVLSQTSSLFYMVVYLPVPTRRACRSNFNNWLHLVNGKNYRNLARICNLQHAKTELCNLETRIPFHPKVRPLDILGWLVALFAPHGASSLQDLTSTHSVHDGYTDCSAEDWLQWFRNTKSKACYDALLGRLNGYILFLTRAPRVIAENADVLFSSKLCEEHILLEILGDGDGKEEETKTEGD